MRPATLALTLTATLFLTGCSKLVSVNPFLTDKEAKVDPALLGVWRDSDDEDTLIVKEGREATMPSPTWTNRRLL